MTDVPFAYPRPRGEAPGIGIVGAGEIVRACHLPAYRTAGFPVRAICDQDFNRADQLADEFDVPRSCKALDEMLDDPKIGVIDIAVPPQALRGIVEQAVAAGKHVLCQKPLGLSLQDAAGVAALVKDAGMRGAVNQQMRYAPAIAQLKRLLVDRRLGALKSAAIGVHVHTPWERWPFWHDVPNFELFGHTIHYADTYRYLLGDPVSVFARTAMAPKRGLPGPIRNQVMLTYPDGLLARIEVDHDAPENEATWRAAIRLAGEDGIADGSNGALFEYPVGREDRLSLHLPERREDYTLEGRWFPDAFMATMGELLCAIEEQREPSNSVADGLGTIALVEAIARSAREGRVVALDEFNTQI